VAERSFKITFLTNTPAVEKSSVCTGKPSLGLRHVADGRHTQSIDTKPVGSPWLDGGVGMARPNTRRRISPCA
jgi:hypothetical protein